MFWHRKQKAPDVWGVEVRTAQHRLRLIEAELATFTHTADVPRLRRLTAAHQAWRETLNRHGVDHPAPLIHW